MDRFYFLFIFSDAIYGFYDVMIGHLQSFMGHLQITTPSIVRRSQSPFVSVQFKFWIRIWKFDSIIRI